MKAIDPRIPGLLPAFDAPFFLGGMAGYGDGPFRRLCRGLGCPFAVTESIQAEMLIRGGRGVVRADPQHAPSGGQHRAGDTPLAGQLIGASPESMAQAATMLVELGYDVVDLNFACPTKKRKGPVSWGGGLLTDPQRAIDILRAVREALPASIPTTLKMRRSWDGSASSGRVFDQIFEMAGTLGYAWVTVHCRTVQQRYEGPGSWPFLRALVDDHPDRLIFGSGDVWNADDVESMREQTGVHAVSIARGAIRRPWIFREVRARYAGRVAQIPSLEETGALLSGLLEDAIDWHGDREAARRFRRLAIPMIDLHPRPLELRRALVDCLSVAALQAALVEFFPGRQLKGRHTSALPRS